MAVLGRILAQFSGKSGIEAGDFLVHSFELRFAALTVLSAAVLSLGAGPSSASGSARHLLPAVSTLQCEEGGGWVAAALRTRQLFCTDGEFKDHLVR